VQGLFKLFAVSAVVMGISHTIAKERICEPLRKKLGGKETWLGYLVSCPYCASHWVAFAVVPLTGAYYVELAVQWGVVSSVLRWFFSAVLVAVIAAFLRVIFYFVDETQGLVKREQKVAEKEAEALPDAVDATDARRMQPRLPPAERPSTH
jgi:hypothetical protein